MSDLISVVTIREILNRYMNLNQVYTLEEIYHLIQDHYDFSIEDSLPSHSKGGWDVKWNRQVRNTLRIGKDKGHLLHDDRRRSRRSTMRKYIRIRWLD